MICLIFEVGFVGLIWYLVWFYEPLLARRKFIGVVCNVFTIVIHVFLALVSPLFLIDR